MTSAFEAEPGFTTTESSQPYSELSSYEAPDILNPGTAIDFVLYKESTVSITVYNLIGKEIRVVLNDTRPAGEYIHILNTAEFAPGVYFYELIVESTEGNRSLRTIKKLTILK